jgi:tRNA-binding protein
VDEPRPIAPVEAFHALDIRAGVVVSAEPFPESRKPSVRLHVDFGPEIGILPSAAQLTRRYDPASLEGTMVLGVVNLPTLRIAGFASRCLVLGVLDPDDPGDVVLVRPDAVGGVAPGWKLG